MISLRCWLDFHKYLWKYERFTMEIDDDYEVHVVKGTGSCQRCGHIITLHDMEKWPKVPEMQKRERGLSGDSTLFQAHTNPRYFQVR